MQESANFELLYVVRQAQVLTKGLIILMQVSDQKLSLLTKDCFMWKHDKAFVGPNENENGLSLTKIVVQWLNWYDQPFY